MKQIDLSDLNSWIQSKKPKVERQFLQDKFEQRTSVQDQGTAGNGL